MKKKQTTYNFGGALSDLAPLMNLAVPGLGTVVGTAASLASTPTNYQPLRQNENPYGYKEGGPIDPPGKKSYNWGDSQLKIGNSDYSSTRRSELPLHEKTGYVPGLSELLYNRISTSNLDVGLKPQITDVLKDLATPMDEYERASNYIDNQFFAKYLGLSSDEKTPNLVKSPYKPSRSKDKNSSYYTLNDLTYIDPQYIVDLYNYNKKKNPNESTFRGVPSITSELDFYGQLPRNSLLKTVKGKEAFDPLMHFTISKGKDDKGTYLSIYDKYDLKSNPAEGVLGKPFEFYDRIYIDDNSNIIDDRWLKANQQYEQEDIQGKDEYDKGDWIKEKSERKYFQQGGPLQVEPTKPLRKPGGRTSPNFMDQVYYKAGNVLGIPNIDYVQKNITFPDNAKATQQYQEYLKKVGQTIDPMQYMAPTPVQREFTALDTLLSSSYEQGGTYASGGVYPSGNDKQLSSDSYQVDYPGNKTDAKSYGPYQFDDNEVIDMLNKFVFSDEKDLGSNGKSPAELVLPHKKSKGKAEKKLQNNPYDAEAKNTVMISDMNALMIAQQQESKKPVNDSTYYKCGGKIKKMYAQGGPIEDIYQGILNLRPKAINEYGESELRKMASTIYDSAYEANIPYQDYVAQMFQESSFNPDIVYGKKGSSVGAQGVTQLMPETFQRLGVNPHNPHEAIPASAEEMSRIINRNAKEGFGTSMTAAQQRYNAGGPSFKKFTKGQKTLTETEDYPMKIKKHKNKAFSAPQEEYIYQGYIDPELLNQYSVKALRNQVSPPRDNTAVAMRTNYIKGGPYDPPYTMDTTDLSQGNWELPPKTRILSSSTDLTPNYINLLKTSGQPKPYGIAFLNAQISKGLPNRRMDMEEIMTPLERGLVNDSTRTPQNILGSTEVYNRAYSPAMATPSDIQVQDINDLMTNGPQVARKKEPGFTVGDALQGVEALGAFRSLLSKPPRTEPLYQMQTRQIDDAPIRRNIASGFNAAASNINTGSMAGRNAVLSNLYSNRLGRESDALQAIANQNKQLAAQTEQYNIGQKRMTDDLNARNIAAYDQAQSAAYQTIGNTGRALNKKKQGKQALKYLEATYPDVFNLLMAKIG